MYLGRLDGVFKPLPHCIEEVLIMIDQNLNPELPSQTMLTFGKCPWSSLFQTIERLEERDRLETLCFAKYRYPQLLQQFFIMDTPP